MKRARIAVMLPCFFLPSCGRGPQVVTSEPSISEVAGRYSLSSSSFGGGVDAEILAKAKDAYIELRADGVAMLHNFPVVPDTKGRDFAKFAVREFRTCSGTFTISAMGGTGKGTIYGMYLNGGELPEPMNHPWLEREGPSLLLGFEYFDGDFTRRMTFTRKQ